MFGRSSKPVKVEVFAKTDRGRTRDHNEDRFLVADLTRQEASLLPDVREHDVGERGSLFVVREPMGGAAAGEVASEMATDTIYQQMIRAWGREREATPHRFAYRLKEAVEVANGHIHAYAKAHPEVRGMGTTTTAVGVLSDHFYLTQVGDSRAYLIRNGQAVQLTKDQSLMQRLVEAGELTEEEAARSERRNIILQALGPDPKVKVDLTYQDVRKGDILVLCSDGLSGQVKKEEIAEATARERDLQAACPSPSISPRGARARSVHVFVGRARRAGRDLPQGSYRARAPPPIRPSVRCRPRSRRFLAARGHRASGRGLHRP